MNISDTRLFNNFKIGITERVSSYNMIIMEIV